MPKHCLVSARQKGLYCWRLFKTIRLSLAIVSFSLSPSPYQKMLLCKMSKKKKGKRSNLRLRFDRKWNNWNPLRLITRVARQPKDGSNCPSLFMSELWKILLPLVTTLYEMQWLEVLVPTLTDNPTMPLKIHLSVTAVKHRSWAMGRKQKQSGSVIMSLCIIYNISHPCCCCCFFFLAIPFFSIT